MRAGSVGVLVALLVVCAFAVFPAARPAASGGQEPALAPVVVPLNTTAASAASLVPDGSSITQVIGSETERWYAARLESGKSYVVEAMQSGRDRTANDILMDLYENDGVSAFGDNLACDSDTNSAPPSMQAMYAASSGVDGKRCSVSLLASNPAKLLLVKLSGFTPPGGSPLMVRIRETTVYGRYTVNSYNMYVAVHNPSAEPVTGYVLYWPENTTANTSASAVGYDYFSLAGYSSTQFVHTAGAWAAPGNRGHVRVCMTSGTDVHVQMYAFNPTANNYLFFQPQRLNNGGGNSW